MLSVEEFKSFNYLNQLLFVGCYCYFTIDFDLLEAGIGETRDGKFRLFERDELDADWSPTSDDWLTVWEATQYLVAALHRSETEAAQLLHLLGGFADQARALAYVLFKRASDRGWADDAAAYNSLITVWMIRRMPGMVKTLSNLWLRSSQQP